MLSSPRTHTQTDTHESKYRGHPLRVSGMFPSTYYQGSVQYMMETEENSKSYLYIQSTIWDNKN